ncbi:MAG: SDR family oxidoreductase, partial [Actinomycetia bacterium]|nr:SDR family oxidoreductase [Actinomycetes bacterium]
SGLLAASSPTSSLRAMDLQLNGKRALVAAASRGLGAAIAESLAGEGCIVELSSRSLANARDTAERIAGETGAALTAAEVDVTDEDAVRGWIDDAARRLGGIDIVIPNAGGPPSATFDETTSRDWDTAYRLTLRSAMSFARSVRPHLTKGGTMLYLTSVSVREPIGPLAMSNVFRAGVAALAKTLANEWARDGIRVNQLIPGRIATERLDELDAAVAGRLGRSSGEAREANEDAIPLGRYGDPGEFAAAATFLVSPAASYITGATLHVDGGVLRSVM